MAAPCPGGRDALCVSAEAEGEIKSNQICGPPGSGSQKTYARCTRTLPLDDALTTLTYPRIHTTAGLSVKLAIKMRADDKTLSTCRLVRYMFIQVQRH